MSVPQANSVNCYHRPCTNSRAKVFPKKLRRLFGSILAQNDRLGLTLRIAAESPLKQSIHHIPIMTLPSSRDTMLSRRRKVQESKHHIVDLLFVVFHLPSLMDLIRLVCPHLSPWLATVSGS